MRWCAALRKALYDMSLEIELRVVNYVAGGFPPF
jgi:hypothetical protein